MRRSRTEALAAWHDRPVIRDVAGAVKTWKGVLVLNYHRVGDGAGQPWDRGLYSATAEALDGQLELLAREADVIAPGDLEAVMAGRRGRHVMVTFDDGYRDNHELALPLLRRHGVPATFFLATGFIDDPKVAWWDEISWMVRTATAAVVPAAPEHGLGLDVPLRATGGEADDDVAIAMLIAHYKALDGDRTASYLGYLAEATGAGRCSADVAAQQWITWDMARELRDAGMAIGGHTVTHPILGRLPADEQEREIAGCAARLREELDLPMRWFSYPVGSRDAFDAATRAALQRHGTELSFSFYGGYQRFGAFDRYDVPRMHVGPRMTPRVMYAVLRMPQLLARADA